MKKLIGIILLAVTITSCYDDFRLDYEYTTIAFSNADGGSNMDDVLYRTAVMGEGMSVDIGVYIAGVIENREERVIDFQLDPTLLAGTGFTLMPNEYYNLDATQFVIEKGSFVGKITIDLDSNAFANDPLAVAPTYALPIALTETTSADSILATQSTKIVVLKYMIDEAGFYEQTLSYTTTDTDGTVLSEATAENELNFTTTGPSSMLSDGMVFKGANYTMEASIGSNNAVGLTYVPNPNLDSSPKNYAREDPNVVIVAPNVSGWENAFAVNTGEPPHVSAAGGNDQGQFGNWPMNGGYDWIEYDFGTTTYNFISTGVMWVSDGGGLLFPNDAYLEYWDAENETFVRVPGTIASVPDEFNEITFNIITTRVRLNFASDQSVGIGEWEIYGTPVPTEPEQAVIESVTTNNSTYDPATSTLTLNYTIDYAFQSYSTDVEATLVWRNRIRDGINEWRR